MEKYNYENLQSLLSDKFVELLFTIPNYKDRYDLLKHCLLYARRFRAKRKEKYILEKESRRATRLLKHIHK